VPVWVPDIFCNFYFMKNHKIADNSTITEAGKETRHKFGIDRIL
jgi:hypothetical protein